MHSRNRFCRLTIIILASLPAFVPSITQASDATPTLIYGGQKPTQLIGVTGATVTIVGAAWWGSVDTALFSANPTATAMVALTALDSHIEATCAEPTSTVGVQFLGDQNDGWARIVIDGEPRWQGNTQGGTLVNDDYIEISGLPVGNHQIQVETMGTPDSNQIGHVTVVAFGCGPLMTTDGSGTPADQGGATDGASSLQRIIYLPTIMS